MKTVFVIVLLILLESHTATASVPPGVQAQYYINSAAEGTPPPFIRARVIAGDRAKVASETCQWWTLQMEAADGSAMAVRVLSQGIPLTSLRGIGKIRRYMVAFHSGNSFEYVDTITGKALLPNLPLFTTEYFPQPSVEAIYPDGFASSGRLLGQSLVRSNIRNDWPAIDFSTVKLLKLRSDLLIGAQADSRADRDPSIPAEKRKDLPLTDNEYRQLIAAGANYFGLAPGPLDWIKAEPVYFRSGGVFPYDYYRSNYVAGQMFLDEPAIRFGWDEWISGDIISPDIIANALSVRVAEGVKRRNRILDKPTGAMQALLPNPPTWETLLWSAYYQLQGGAAGLIYEGRYVDRGYGWDPEFLLGDTLKSLTDRQQYDHFDSYLRGAARRYNGNWGTSVYGEGDKTKMASALIQAYDQGAKWLLFWVEPRLPFEFRLKVLRELQDHITKNPSRKHDVADTAIVLPPGYIPKEDGILGMQGQALSPGGASYADIAAAALFEGIVLSRAGIQYDTTFDDPVLKKLGYKKLIFILTDGSIKHVPSIGRQRRVAPLRVEIGSKAHPSPPTVSRKTLEQARPGLPSRNAEDSGAAITTATASPRFMIPYVSSRTVDADLNDWSSAAWIPLNERAQLWADNWKTSVTLDIPAELPQQKDHTDLGFTWEGITRGLREKYQLDGWSSDQVVVTSVRPNTPAAKAGLREGDIISYWDDRRIRWAFEVWGMIDAMRRSMPTQITFQLQRGGLDFYQGDTDLSARVAFAWGKEAESSNDCLYIAAEVTDNSQQQTMRNPDIWKNDSVQIGIDPVLARTNGYGKYGSEIGLALRDGKPIVYRWQGSRGKPVGAIRNCRIAIRRIDGRTVYEAAVPLSELAPLTPDMWNRVGMDVVVNDSDTGQARKVFRELSLGAMTQGKQLDLFPVFEFEPSNDHNKISAALFWDSRSMPVGKGWEARVVLASPASSTARLTARLKSMDGNTATQDFSLNLPVTSQPQELPIIIKTASGIGRYLLTLKLWGADGRLAASDSQPVYIYQ